MYTCKHAFLVMAWKHREQNGILSYENGDLIKELKFPRIYPCICALLLEQIIFALNCKDDV